MKKEHHGKHHKGEGKGHTGHIRHPDMGSYIDGSGTPDPIAHSSHHEANKHHGTPGLMSPKGDYKESGGHGDEECYDEEME